MNGNVASELPNPSKAYNKAATNKRKRGLTFIWINNLMQDIYFN